jgi:FkbM family methyltransferase
MSNFSHFARMALRHIKNGSIIWRIKNHVRIERERKWLNFLEGEKAFLDVTMKGLGFRLRLYRNDLLSKALYFGEYEPNELNFLAKFLQQGDTFIDVGANLGLFSILAGSKVKSSGRVYGFEPSVENFKRLKENISLNRLTNIRCFCLGISDKSESKMLHHFNAGHGALSSYSNQGREDYSHVETRTISLATFVRDEKINKIDAIKIDVEGWELPVLIGAEEILVQGDAPLLMIEFNDLNARNAGFSCQEIFDRLVDYGYDLYKYDVTTGKLALQSKKDYYEYQNFIALKRKSNAFLKARSKALC